MKVIDTIHFIDSDSGQEAMAIIRAGEGHIMLCLSLKEDGDIEVALPPTECERLLRALRQALASPQTGQAG